MKKKIVLLGVFIGLLFLVLLIKPVVSPVKPLSPKPQWQTYQNKKFNFQFDYPIDWQKEEWDLEEATTYKTLTDGKILYQGKFFGKDGHFEILVWQNKSMVAARNFLTWYRHEDLDLANLPVTENDQVASISGIRYFQEKNARNKPVLYHFFVHDDHLYELTEENPGPVYNPILKSFKFLSQ